MMKQTEKISLNELSNLVKPEIDAIRDKIEAIANEKGIDLLKPVIKKLLTELIEDLHVKAFVKNKMRKARRWAKKQWTKLWDW